MGETMSRAYRDVLAVPGARALIGASAASQIGNWLYNAALLGYVYGATRSAGWVGAATICRGLLKVLLGPFGGAVADRYRRRTVSLAGDALRVLLMAALAAIVATAGPAALVIAFAALTSAAGCAEKPAAMALLPRLAAGWIVTVIGGYALRWSWTGYPGHTLWDWLGMLLPLVFPAILLPSLLKWVSGNAAGRASAAYRATMARTVIAAP